jgi:hypothetical protein
VTCTARNRCPSVRCDWVTCGPMKKLLFILALVGLAAFAAKKVTASA